MLPQAQSFGKAVLANAPLPCGNNWDRRRKVLTVCEQSRSELDTNLCYASSRRSLLTTAVLVASTAAVPLSFAGDNGLLEFLKSRQRANGGEKLLAPIRSARMRLEAARTLLQAAKSEAEYKNILGLVRSASFNCYVFESFSDDSLETKASLLQQQLQIGDPCTFRIISRNVTNLLDASDEELVARTAADLENLIRAFQLLDDMIDRVRLGESGATKMAEDTLNLTIARTVAFEDSIKKCLGLELV